MEPLVSTEVSPPGTPLLVKYDNTYRSGVWHLVVENDVGEAAYSSFYHGNCGSTSWVTSMVGTYIHVE